VLLGPYWDGLMNLNCFSRRALRHERLVARAAGVAVLSAAAVLFSASAAGAKSSSCHKVTPTLIKSTLGVAVPAPSEVRNGLVFECMFGQPGTTARALVTVDFQTDVSPAKLKAMRGVFGAHSTATFSGLGLPAFSSVQGTGSARNNGLVVLKGSTAVEVFWGGPLAKITALVRKILPSM
jgi:hypothetical protein